MIYASTEIEDRLLASGHRFVIGLDEVGRGALAGPVSVGATIRWIGQSAPPVGLADSKLLKPARREQLTPAITDWAPTYVGHCWPHEIDALGMTAALDRAAARALRGLGSLWTQAAVEESTVLFLDGTHCFLTQTTRENVSIRTQAKADRDLACVAAASIVAKTVRDWVMRRQHRRHPEYLWDQNKGYAAPSHVAALQSVGVSPYHRRSWKLPGLQPGLGEPASQG